VALFASRTLPADSPWLVRESGFPATAGLPEKLRFLLHYAVLASSPNNTQPWIFRMGSDSVSAYADPERALAIYDPDHREQVIAVGAAVSGLRTAMRAFGLGVRLDIRPNALSGDALDGPLAIIKADGLKNPRRRDIALMRAAVRRRTARGALSAKTVPSEILALFQSAAASQGMRLLFVTSDEKRQLLAGMTAQATRLKFADKAFRTELASWIRRPSSPRRDGLTADALALPAPGIGLGAWGITRFDRSSAIGTHVRRQTLNAPVVALLVSKGDARHDRFQAGLAAGDLSLTATAAGAAMGGLNFPLSDPEMRSRLREAFELRGYPQQILRFGYQGPVQPTPRRPLDDVIRAG